MTTILITGASAGIGRATALALSQSPDTRVLAVARRENRLRQLAEQAGDQLQYFAADLSDAGAAAELADWVGGYAPLTGLINNAGLLINKPFAELTDPDWASLFAVNVLAPARLIRLLLPHFDPAGAHIVNIGSMGGYAGSAKFPGLAAYSATKGALATLTECLAEELQEQKIFCNCLALGAVQTEMLAQAFPGYQAPLQDHEMAEFFAFFVRQGHRFFNGKVLPVSVATP
jgi:NAD(P)-dependent dehydrogenase (short-subunit alcohol dehydrogenase family)